MFKVNNRNTRKRFEKSLKLTIKAQPRRHYRRSSVYILNFEHIIVNFEHVLLLLTLNMQMFAGMLIVNILETTRENY